MTKPSNTPIMLSLRCILASPPQNPSDPYAGERVVMTPSFSDDPNHPNARLFKGQPNGLLDITINNKELWGQLKQGESYDITFVPSQHEAPVTSGR